MGLKSRTKGAAGEREVAGILNAYGLTANRTAMMQTQSSSAAPDVSVVEWPDVWIEVKRGKVVNPRGAHNQALAEVHDAGRISTTCLAITRADRSEWMVYGGMDAIYNGEHRLVERSLWHWMVTGVKPLLRHHFDRAKEYADAVEVRPILVVRHAASVNDPLMAYLKLTDLLWLWGQDKEGESA